MLSALVARVAVESTAYKFDTFFDYIVPEPLVSELKLGSRVLVPFGGGNRTRQAVVFDTFKSEESENLKSIIAVLDKAPLLSNEMLKLAVWMKEKYYCTFFEAIKLMIPTGINVKASYEYRVAENVLGKTIEKLTCKEKDIILFVENKEGFVKQNVLEKEFGLKKNSKILNKLVLLNILEKREITSRKINDAKISMVRLKENTNKDYKFTAKQKKVYEYLINNKEISLKELCYFTGVTKAVVSNLEKNGIVEFFEEEKYRNPYEERKLKENINEIILNEEQNKAFKSLYDQYKSSKEEISLLYGVTGSGKTSVFMKLIDEALKDDIGVIVMVPEISLTAQLLQLFHDRYGSNVAVFHSGLSGAERLDEWKRVKLGKAKIAIGTRSAIFAPVENLKLIVMDEEQEYTYKSDSSPRFHARDIARFRCAYNKGLLVLASATPSIPTYYLAQCGKYNFSKIGSRYGKASMVEVKVVDMNLEVEEGNYTQFSYELLNSINSNIIEGKQSILLLNRRGYNTFVSCRACKEVISCPNCSISMTYHSDNNMLMCHYCGYSVEFTEECPYCKEKEVKYLGIGTQKIEKDLEKMLPNARILRMDTDSMMSKFSYEKKLEEFSAGKYDIMIGTQMVAKGLNFENVTLVGVLSADQSLYADDFRSYERAFSLLTQVVGRAGRGKFLGRAIVQTFTPENEIIKLAAEQDYENFYNDEIKIRKAMLYPPFVDICVIGFVSMNEKLCIDSSKEFFNCLVKLAKLEYSELPLRIYPPSAASIRKVNNKYRYKIIIKCRDSKKFRKMISEQILSFEKNVKNTKVSVFVDINPDIII